ncbi:uncharacterized protein SOCG_01110 [Schizosaccharomyces octosporus yFS286]|uniref:Uncharacterized protein n=1 Tax=Schizosaccharomyces octosporus (strain yFS286) TaxID=483514 RepID=S9R4T0_SCHOY|nr:uncharacterized protein SOCG_01110 [Schizosaccharomyces octosporus yFS286]EPX73360.1 hypothetical protein SOCG_01110 [Schizosaccharomyces octosporus yFS286]
MRNNYTPVSNSDNSVKVLNFEKSDTRSWNGIGTPSSVLRTEIAGMVGMVDLVEGIELLPIVEQAANV